MSRGLGFDPDRALNAAMREFWLKGYDGTSITDLTCAMQIARPSLYNVFGNKEQLFQKSLARYQALQLAFIPSALQGATAVEVAALFMEGFVKAIAGSCEPPGCLGVQAIVAGAQGSEFVRAALIESLDRVQALLRERFAQAKMQEKLSADADSEALADYLIATCCGLAVMAKIGMPQATLIEVARIAQAAFRAA